MTRTVIAGFARTPFGRFGGALKELSAVELGALALREALARAHVAPEDMSESYIGSAVLAGATLVTARQVNIKAGVPPSTPSLTVDRACCSSMTAVGLARMRIGSGESSIVVAGGVESCSRTPFLQHGTRWGRRLGDFTVEDPLQFRNPLTGEPLARVTGEVALKWGVDREMQDDWACASHEKFFHALEAGFFKTEVMPVERNGEAPLMFDESPRKGLLRSKLAELKTVYGGPTVTPGNAPGLNDGASAVVLMSDDEAKRRGAEVLGEVVGHVQLAGALDSSPFLPGDAIRTVLQKAGVPLREVKLIEINEAFAVMPLVSTLRLADENKSGAERLRAITNVHGGAVALGHPTGASGARLVMTLAAALRARGGGYGVAAICGGFGQADAVLLKV